MGMPMPPSMTPGGGGGGMDPQAMAAMMAGGGGQAGPPVPPMAETAARHPKGKGKHKGRHGKKGKKK